MGTTKAATGMQVTERLVSQSEAQKPQKAHDLDAKLQRKKEDEEKAKEQAPLIKAAATDLLHIFKNGQAWENQTVPVLRAAYEYFTGREAPPTTSNGASVTKKDYIDALTPIIWRETEPSLH